MQHAQMGRCTHADLMFQYCKRNIYSIRQIKHVRKTHISRRNLCEKWQMTPLRCGGVGFLCEDGRFLCGQICLCVREETLCNTAPIKSGEVIKNAIVRWISQFGDYTWNSDDLEIKASRNFLDEPRLVRISQSGAMWSSLLKTHPKIPAIFPQCPSPKCPEEIDTTLRSGWLFHLVHNPKPDCMHHCMHWSHLEDRAHEAYFVFNLLKTYLNVNIFQLNFIHIHRRYLQITVKELYWLELGERFYGKQKFDKIFFMIVTWYTENQVNCSVYAEK
jgi:hypothetical protein